VIEKRLMTQNLDPVVFPSAATKNMLCYY
jgi:hypothetical protein